LGSKLIAPYCLLQFWDRGATASDACFGEFGLQPDLVSLDGLAEGVGCCRSDAILCEEVVVYEEEREEGGELVQVFLVSQQDSFGASLVKHTMRKI
jgi:hypothetical protein